MKINIRLAGSGGQGIILATVILADAAVMADRNAAQSQSYGPEARGGSCKAEVIVSDEDIGFTKIKYPDFFMALTEDALNKYKDSISEQCDVLIDESMEFDSAIKCRKLIKLPILRIAKEEVGKAMTANIVAVACINHILDLVDSETLKEAVVAHIPKGTEQLNYKALAAGEKLAAAIK